jgi:hypothetical protein
MRAHYQKFKEYILVKKVEEFYKKQRSKSINQTYPILNSSIDQEDLINLILEPNNEEYIELFFNEQLDYNGRFQQKPPNIFSKNTDNQWYPCKMIEYGHLNRLINL